MTDFLFLLGKLNLALGAAVVAAYLLRRPLRALFGAPIAYALWLLVPIAVLASLLPPRVTTPAPLTHLQNLAGQYAALPMSVIGQIAPPASRLTEQFTAQTALVHPMIAARAASLAYGTPDYATLFFAAWALGAMAMLLYLARLQILFHADTRLGEAGPAVLGFFRPHIVMPDAFEDQYTAPEQAAILAHERVHLARQDARINALAALLRCLCWFNPLVHLGAAWLRLDQELACDATALAGPVSRRAYAHALLKSQMIKTALPLGCNWPGSEHPLVERIALLKRKRPGTARRITGTGLVMAAAIFVGLGAWAAQPPVTAKFIASPYLNNPIALANPQIEPLSVGDARPARTARLDDAYVVPRRIAAIKPSQISSMVAPILIAAVDLLPAPDTLPAVAVAQSEAPPHPPSVAAQELANLDAPVNQYPASVLKMNASPGFDGWNNADAMKYCRDFAIQTVTQGANVPLIVDDGVKQRLNFFYWHCTFANINGTYAHSGGGMSPGYVALGPASPDHPVNVTGHWSISIPLYAQADMAGLKAMQTEPQGCNFTQSGNTITGTCTGRNDTGALTGVIDGRQVRWVWKFPQGDGRHQSELDFLGLVGSDGAMSGQSINLQFGSHLGAFMATPGPAQVASQD